jgi:Ohr subfamily peroxiredoxin
MPNTLYSTKVTATGGRNGSIRSDDGLLDLRLAMPRTLGGKGDATNPEQLFAGGYAACFENALLRVSREARYKFADGDVEVVAEIGVSRNGSGAFVLVRRARRDHRRRRPEDGGTACRGRPRHLSLLECDQGQCRCPNRRLGSVN